MTDTDKGALLDAFHAFTDTWRDELQVAFDKYSVPTHRSDVALWDDDKLVAIGHAYRWNADRVARAHK